MGGQKNISNAIKTTH